MLRFNLLLVDSDEWYIDSLYKFTRNSYASKFNVNVFTQKLTLLEFLESNSEKTDILVISPDLLCDEIQKYNTGIVIVLSNGRASDVCNGLPYINKYQPGEKILNNIIDLYSGKDASIESLVKGAKKTGIISVFSPQGGSGKTVISINLALQYARMGLKTLYLNFESMSSTSFFLNSSNNELGLSNVLFYLKDNIKNIAVKIDAAKSFNSELNISYFEPANSSCELDELSGNDISRLLHELKEIGQFEVIIVDTDSVINRRNMALFSGSDSILLITVQDILTCHKLDILEKEIKKITNDYREEFFNKVNPVVNKFVPNSIIDNIYFNGEVITDRIPYLTNMYVSSGERCIFNTDCNIDIYMKMISRNLLEKANIAMSERV